jgi:hypothetical protein
MGIGSFGTSRASLPVELEPEGLRDPGALELELPLVGCSCRTAQLESAQRSRFFKREKTMKITLFLLCFLCATLSFGQSSVAISPLVNEPQMVSFYSHPNHATQHDMSEAQNLLERSTVVYAQGERPLWEVAAKSHATPLGDVARALRKEHESVKKADVIWQN